MMKIRGLLFLLAWFILTALVGIFGFPALATRALAEKMSVFWARSTLVLLRVICGIDSQVRGHLNIQKDAVIYAVKHQSTWDTMMLRITLKEPVFVLKKELYLIPVFGWFLWRTGNIAINRKAGKKSLQAMIDQARYYHQNDRPIVIFPEGTRTKPFATTRYKSGIAHVSAALNIAVVPVALNAGRVWPKSLLEKHKGTAVIEFLPIMPAAGEAKEPWLDDLSQRIETATSALLKQL